MLMYAKVGYFHTGAICINRAGRRIGDKPCLMQIVFHIGVVFKRPVTACNRGLMDQKISAHRVDRHRILRQKYTGGIITVKRRLLPSGVIPCDRGALRRGAEQGVKQIQHRLPAQFFICHQVNQRTVDTHFVPCQELMQVCPLRRAHGISVEKGTEMVFAAKGDAVAVSFQVCKVDDIFRLGDAGWQIVDRTAEGV